MTLTILRHVDLQPFCTLATPAQANYYCVVGSVDDVSQALAFAKRECLEFLVLGGGSNIVMAGDFAGLVIHIQLKGIEIEPHAEHFLVTAFAGNTWQSLVDFSLARGLWGLENLNLIPGTVGAAPIQNIGAYGVELDQVFHQLTAISVKDGELVVFDKADCQFSYRNSVFKQLSNQFIVLKVTLKLSKEALPVLDYPGLRQALGEVLVETLSSSDIANAVAKLRRAKLPDPTIIPNTGSFFHNPVVSNEMVEKLRSEFPDLVAYPLPDGRHKLAAAWLIDRAGLKGTNKDGVGVHSEQALVIVNPGCRSGRQVLEFAESIKAHVYNMFGVRLVIEPQVYP